MTELYVDPDGLTAVSEVARRQHDHVGRVSDYISSTCSQFGAFSGVLNIFEGSYRDAVGNALDGMSDGKTIATKVETTVAGCRQDYLDSDREAYEEMKGLFGDMSGFPPYQAPGSGSSVPGGPLSAPPAPGGTPEDGDPFSLPGLPTPIDGPLGRVLPDSDDSLPPWLDPANFAKDGIVDHVRHEQMVDRYLEYRDQGLSPEEARDAARRDGDSDAQGQERVDRTTRERTESAYDDAYDRAIADGKTPDEAREAGQDAAQERHHEDTADTGRRRDIADAAGTYKGAYDGVNEAIGNVQDLKENVEQLAETNDDLDDYDDYESGSGSSDRSAQDWGSK